MQKIINKKQKLTKEEHEAIYYNAKFHERTWFRLMMDLIIMYSTSSLLNIEDKDIVKIAIIYIVSSLCVLYVWRGKSRTKIGYIIQRIYCITIIIATIIAFIGYLLIILGVVYFYGDY